jgi:hypothetical protein
MVTAAAPRSLFIPSPPLISFAHPKFHILRTIP